MRMNARKPPKGPVSLMYRMHRYILPEVKNQLLYWNNVARNIPDPELKKQALASMETKMFHCQGGSTYAALDLSQRHILVPLIVAFQTISDYLDNLCDRSTSMDGDDFRLLHQSMLDAVNPKASLTNYYALRKEQNDGDYLHRLVKTCQSCIYMLPSYSLVQPFVEELVSYYCDLQVYKHIAHDIREEQMLAWWEKHRSRYPHLYWNEFAAATGSTLGVFMLFAAASDPHLERSTAQQIRNAYFPHVCGLHILLDYLIDQEEDRIGGDLNFCFYYPDSGTKVERILYMIQQARNDVKDLDQPLFHRMIIEGLLALYLSDPKVGQQEDVKRITGELMKNSPLMRLFFWLNSVWIRKRYKL